MGKADTSGACDVWDAGSSLNTAPVCADAEDTERHTIRAIAPLATVFDMTHSPQPNPTRVAAQGGKINFHSPKLRFEPVFAHRLPLPCPACSPKRKAKT